jgi:hypothetical protein
MTIKLRGFNAASWVGTEVLAERQVGLELDTRRMKVGDGTTTWAALPYFGGGGGGLSLGLSSAIAAGQFMN